MTETGSLSLSDLLQAMMEGGQDEVIASDSGSSGGVEQDCPHPAVWPTMDKEKAREMDKDLAWDDAVSLTFLVVENVSTAYKVCRWVANN